MRLRFILIPPTKFRRTKPTSMLTPAQKRNRAYNILGHARTRGAVGDLPCCVCGNQKAQAHHEDYSLPHVLTFLCSKHHGKRHSDLRRGKKCAIPRRVSATAAKYLIQQTGSI